MSLAFNAKSLDAKATAFGLPSAPVVNTATPVASSKVTKNVSPIAFNAHIGATCQTMVPGTIVPEPATLLKGCVSLVKDLQAMKVVAESTDKRIQLFKRETSTEIYGSISAAVENGTPKAIFCHYPVHSLDEKDLKAHVYNWAEMDIFEGKTVKNMRLQFNGLLIKVFADASGALRFVTKTKAQLCKEHETILLDTLVQNMMDISGITDLVEARNSVTAALMAYTNMGITLTFRLVHPAVCYVVGPLDMSKSGPKAILVQWGDKHIDNQKELPLQDGFLTASDVMKDCDIDSFGAVMIEFCDPATNVTHYAKLVSTQFREKLQLVEGINGNFVAHLTRAGLKQAPAIRKALDAVHWPAFDTAVKVIGERSADGPAIVARFLERNRTTLLNEKSPLVGALFKMDTKKATKMTGAAKMFNPKRGTCQTFIDGMKPDEVARHVQLLTTIVDGKLDHTNPEVAAAARLIKSCL